MTASDCATGQPLRRTPVGHSGESSPAKSSNSRTSSAFASRSSVLRVAFDWPCSMTLTLVQNNSARIARSTHEEEEQHRTLSRQSAARPRRSTRGGSGDVPEVDRQGADPEGN